MGRQRRYGKTALLATTLLIVASTFTAGQAAATPENDGEIAFDTDAIGEGLRASGEVRLFVSLDVRAGEARAMLSEPDGVASLQEEVGKAQASVVASLFAAITDENAAGFEVEREFSSVPAMAVTVRSEAALAALRDHPHVVGLQVDSGGTGSLANSVPFISADHRHAVGNAGDGVTVAVLDTGADLDHPDLVDDVLDDQACFGDNNSAIDGTGFCSNGSDRQTGAGAGEDDAGHGTHVSGIVTSAGTVSSPGSAPGAEIIPVKVLDDCTFSGCFYAFSEIVAAWDWIIANNDDLGIDVVNMSLGTGAQYAGDCDATFPAAATAAASLRSIGVTPFASSGNNSGTMMGAPACLSDVIAVGATDNADNVAAFSDSNASTDIFAPGVNVLSLAIGGGTTTASGTSMASPHAAGCAALLIEAGDATTPAGIETRLETSAFTVTDNGLTFPRIDCGIDDDAPPIASVGGPYVTIEGTDVTLDASGSDPEGGAVTIEWDLDDDGSFDDATGETAQFDTVGQDGVFTVTVRVTDPSDLTSEASTTVTVQNVAPAIVADVVPAAIDENMSVTVSGTVTDPGWLDPLTATIDWDDGAGPVPLVGVSDNVRPDATLSFSAGFTYGDNGVFDIEVCGSDDDTSTCTHVGVVVDNVDPTAAIDAGETVAFPGGPALVTSAGEPLDVSVDVTDPGSDDLTVAWDWDDGPPTPDVVTVSLNDPPALDPSPSPEINPRAITDEQTVTFAAACLYEVGLEVSDDDDGSTSDSIDVIVVGNATEVRSAGYWYQQFRGKQSQSVDDETLLCHLSAVDLVSSVFNETTSAATLAEARDILWGRTASSSASAILDRQLLASWLNFLNGTVGWDEFVDTDDDGVVDTAFGEVIAGAETVRNDATASDAQLLEQKDLLEGFNAGG